MKKLFNFILAASLLFLAYYLYKHSYLRIPVILNWQYLLLSLLLLFAGFIVNALTWHYTLIRYGIAVSHWVSIASSGLSVFAKYIPGKVMVILGRSVYVSSKVNVPVKKTTLISLNAQLLMLWVGLLFGSMSFVSGSNNPGLLYTSVVLWLILSVVIFSGPILDRVESIYNRVLKKQLAIPRLRFSETLALLPSFLLNWVLWSAAYYLLIVSLTDANVSLFASFGFALAGSAGIVALITPGGLGVREGILAGILLLNGLSESDAVTISVAARLWFLIGEVFLFVVALFIDRYFMPGVSPSE